MPPPKLLAALRICTTKLSKTILKRVISGKKQKGSREYKREAEARERSDAPPTEEERPEQPTAPVAEDAPATDPDKQIFIDLQELVCKLCEEKYAPEEVLINHYNMQHPECVQNIVCRYCYEVLQGYPSYLEHVDEHNADNCKCLLCNKVCRTLNKLGKHMKKSHPVSEEADDPGDQAEDAPKDTGEVEDTPQQQQPTPQPQSTGASAGASTAADRDNHRRDVHTHPRHSCDVPQLSTGRTGASARSVRGDLLRGIGSSTTA